MPSRHALIHRPPSRVAFSCAHDADEGFRAAGLLASRRTLLQAFLLICLVWQALTMAGQLRLPMQSPEELGHLASMHWSEKLHHHEEGGQLHQDTSQQSIDHLAQDDLIDPPILFLACDWPNTARILTNAPPYRDGAPSSLALEPLQKPPQIA